MKDKQPTSTYWDNKPVHLPACAKNSLCNKSNVVRPCVMCYKWCIMLHGNILDTFTVQNRDCKQINNMVPGFHGKSFLWQVYGLNWFCWLQALHILSYFHILSEQISSPAPQNQTILCSVLSEYFQRLMEVGTQSYFYSFKFSCGINQLLDWQMIMLLLL